MTARFLSLHFGLDRLGLCFDKFSGVKIFGLMFFAGFLVRLVPELLAFPLPIGFDTVYYAAVLKSGVIWANWSSFFNSAWLLYAITVPIYGLLQIDPFLLLKIVGPLLFGFNVAGICWFARRMLGWDLRMSVFAGVFFALQLASLRISWDLLRNTLGLGILLFALSSIKKVDSMRGFALFSVLSLMTVFAHEYAAVTLLVVVLGLIAWQLFKQNLYLDSMRLMSGILPALAIFVVGLVLRFSSVDIATEGNVIAKNQLTNSSGIHIRGSNNIICANRIANGSAALEIFWGDNNTFCANHLVNNTFGARVGFDQTDISRQSGPSTVQNTLYHNNFMGNGQQAIDWNWVGTNSWDNGKQGNYWSDYTGGDWNFDGIGDASYKLSEAVSFYAPSIQSEDRYPLMAPFDIDSATVELPEWASSLLSSLPSPSPTATPTKPEPEPFPTTLIAAPITLAIVIGIGLLVYFKKCKH
jgi:hypothetical protein